LTDKHVPLYREGQRMELVTHRMQIGWLRAWVVLLTFLVMFGAVATGYQFFQLRSFTTETRTALVRTQLALCTFRGDLQTRVDASKEFLKSHPHGLPGLATANQLQDDINNRSRAIASLRGLSCPPPIAPKR
jgi:uncharacterized protein involved in exopolysaccharide biosynthesis